MQTAFFFDSKALGRNWTLDSDSQALSGTDGALLQVYNGLSLKNKNVILLATSKAVKSNEQLYVVDDLISAYEYCISNNYDFLIFNSNTAPIQYKLFLYATAKHKTRLIAWAQNTPVFNWNSAAWSCDAFYKLVAVSNIQRNSLSQHPIYNKTIVITNFVSDFFVTNTKKIKPQKQTIVTYIGALRPSKGFNHLAEVWPKIHNQFPQARLNVCGSPGLYRSDLVLGPEGIAEIEFEKKILSFLGGSKKSAMTMGVDFLGSVPKNKLYENICNSRLVIVNPNMPNNGSIETFCVSAVEAMSLEVPVVGGAAGGLLEIVGHNKGGLLAKDANELEKSICSLLSNNELSNKLAGQGRARVLKYFTKNTALDRWEILISGQPISASTQTDIVTTNLAFYIKSAFRAIAPLPLINEVRKAKHRLLHLSN